MVKRRTKLAMAAIASIGGVVAGGKLYLRRQMEREDNLGVTLYSEPHYRGMSRTLTRENVCSLGETGLPRVGSVRVQRITNAIRPALLEVPLVWGWVRSSITSLISRDLEGARDSGYNAAELMMSVLHPDSWRVEGDLAGDLQSWVRLWANRPTGDEAAGAGEQAWYDVLTDTPDLGVWSTRTRYLEVGVRRP